MGIGMRSSSALPLVRGRLAAATALLALVSGEAAPAQPPEAPGCPENLTWPNIPRMRFTVQQVDGQDVLLAEGVIDEGVIPRLEQALDDFRGQEIRLRSPGGNARVGNLAGRLIHQRGLVTRIPAGWACASACAFMFMGGIVRSVDPGGLVMVQMFTHLSDDPALQRNVARGGDSADRLLTAIARDSAMMAAEDNDYLIYLGISRRLLIDIVYQQPAVDAHGRPAPPHCLTMEELRRYNILNGVIASPTAASSGPAKAVRAAK
jgi:hypothetical protein